MPVGVPDLKARGFLPGLTRQSTKNVIAQVKFPGIFVFGGLTDAGLTNRLTVVAFSEDQLAFTEPAAKGHPPGPRYMHSSHYLRKSNIFVIVGGNTTIGDSLARQLDIYVLELAAFNWITVQAGSSLPTFAGHAAAESEDSIYFFGGINSDNYRDNEIRVIDFTAELQSRSPRKDPLQSRIFLTMGGT